MLWKKDDEKLIRDGFRKILLKSFTLPNGQKKDFEIKKESNVASVLAITKENKIILTKQFRPGPEKIFFELPGGVIDTNESPEAAINRELLEETGYGGSIKFLATIPRCAYSTGWRYAFVATDCEKVAEQELDETEFIEVSEMSLEDFRNHLRSGQLSDVHVGYLGLDYLGWL
ncbi:MAG: NUDIX hydrolase [Candidatus Uhrbacteria bacterium]